MHLSALLLSLVGFLFTEAGLSTALTAAATAAAVMLVCRTLVGAAVLSAPRVPPGRVRTAIRDRERRTAFLPQRDPDAAGRPRPRAPGGRVPTAA
jgi:ABC-type branched-subunit amino acid transport system permease subunit